MNTDSIKDAREELLALKAQIDTSIAEMKRTTTQSVLSIVVGGIISVCVGSVMGNLQKMYPVRTGKLGSTASKIGNAVIPQIIGNAVAGKVMNILEED